MTFCYSIQNRNNPFCCTLDFSFEFLLFGFRFGIFDGFELKIKASNEMEWANILRHCDFYHPPSSQAPYQSGCLCRIFFFDDNAKSFSVPTPVCSISIDKPIEIYAIRNAPIPHRWYISMYIKGDDMIWDDHTHTQAFASQMPCWKIP